MARCRKSTKPDSGLAAFKSVGLAHGAAVLALWPLNSDRHVALSALVEVVAQAPAGFPAEGNPITPGYWRRWLASPSSEALRGIQPDGVHDAPLSVPSALRGRRYDLLAGALEGPDLLFRVWIDALDVAGGVQSDRFLGQAADILSQTAAISDSVVRRARLGAYSWPHHRSEKGIAVPDDETFGRLRDALLWRTGDTDHRALAPVMRTGGTGDAWRPLVAVAGGKILVADPWTLSRSALGVAAAWAARSPNWRAVIKSLNTATLTVACEAAADMDWDVDVLDDATLLARVDRECLVVIGAHVAVPESDDQDGQRALDAALEQRVRDITVVAAARSAQHTLLVLVGDGRSLQVRRDHVLLRDSGSQTPWVVGVAELRLLGDALRRDPLALPSALVPSARPPWPESLDLVDVVGSSRRLEEPMPERSEVPIDGTEHLRLRGRLMAARHVVPTEDATEWTEVTRWDGSPDDALFAVPGRDGLSLVVRRPGLNFYVTAADPAARRDNLAGVVTVMLAYWLARLTEHGWPLLPAPLRASEMVMAFRVELSDMVGPVLMATSGGEARVLVGPAFVHAMCRGDNDADRRLVRAVVSSAADRGADEQSSLIDVVAPAGRGTFVIWPAPGVRANPPRLPPPPLVAARDRRDVEVAIASAIAGREHIFAFSDQDAVGPLGELLAVVERGLQQQVAELREDALLDLIRLHEQALVQGTIEGVSLPARAALVEADTHLGPRESVGARNLVLRALIARRRRAADRTRCAVAATRRLATSCN